MAHVPVQDGGSRNWTRSSTRIAAAGKQTQPARYLHQSSQRDAVERDGMPAPQRIHVHSMAVIGRYHGQAGQTAFRSFRLPNDGHVHRIREIQQTRHAPYIRMPVSGLK